MNKIILITFFICQSALFSQEIENTSKYQTNELKINLLNTLVFAYPELNYERVFSGDYGIGISAAALLFGKHAYRFHLLPYGRIYFINTKKTSAFFLEVNMGFMEHREYNTWVNGVPTEYDTHKGFGLGLAGGKKFFFKDIIGEIFVGGGNNFGEDFFIYPRVGVIIGF